MTNERPNIDMMQRIGADRATLLNDNLFFSIPANFISFLIVFVGFYNEVNHTHLFIWFIAAVFTFALHGSVFIINRTNSFPTEYYSSELSKLGRSIKETLNTIEVIVSKKRSRLVLVLVKQNLDLNPNDKNNVANKVLITIFSMLAELERDFISERTKEGLSVRHAKGIIQSSMYDKNKKKIIRLYQ